eukprot:TRINITY_DN8171_c0_g1_i1.p1 TRINITY_DN8171_c0_g1~~TRINITY_DN8171_c0_g1_i1.p1  ORF type:complete len:817 (+),score=277.22 TRINITY_DN8171_c0_g1_i1:117-2567(+)
MGCRHSVPLDAPPAECGVLLPTSKRARYEGRERQLQVDGKWWTSDRHAVMPPRTAVNPDVPAGHRPTTLGELFRAAARAHGDKEALRVERLADGKAPEGTDPDVPANWRVWTWSEYYAESCSAAKGFLALGLQDKNSVCVFGFNSPEWFMAQQGAMLANGAVCGIYPTDKTDNVQYKARHTACNVICVDSLKKVTLVKQIVEGDIEGGIPSLRAIVYWNPGETTPMRSFTHGSQTVKVLSWKQLITEQSARTSDEALMAAQGRTAPGSLCGYIYTSGTTGKPKAVMVSHDNICYMCHCMRIVASEVGTGGQERVISYLPLSHVAGMLVDIAVPLFHTSNGKGWFTTTFARPTDLSQMTLANRIQAVCPTWFLGVPRVWEKIRDRMIAAAAQQQAALDEKTRQRVASAKQRGREWALNMQMGGSGRRPGSCIDHLIDNKIYAKVKERLGLSHCKFAMTGAAPIDASCLSFFAQVGININELYGMSECCGATTANNNRAHVWGSCGWALPGAEVRVFKAGAEGNCAADRPKVEPPLCRSFADLAREPGATVGEEYQGEVCFRGRHIMMGYMANPDLGEEHVKEIERKNAEAIDADGWLHSGDKGAMDEQGLLRITGRFKEIIIPAGGENVSPIPIEEHIKRDPQVNHIISNVMMVGDKRKYCVALVSLKVDGATGQEPGEHDLTKECMKQLKSAGGFSDTVHEAVDDVAVISMIAHAIVRANNNPAVCPNSAATIKAFTIIPRDFSEQGGQLTATLKLKRSVVEAEHACVVGVRDVVDGCDPGMTGLLYKGDLQLVRGVGKCYHRYPYSGLPQTTILG